ISGLQPVPRHLLIDGNSFQPFGNIKYTTIVGGDSLFLPIAAASVLAKTFREEFMVKIHEEYPCYGWNTNKGYGTLFHRKAILKHGISPYHRKSFSLFNTQLPIGF
ncbi:MAG: ribonuclease HII, partial [Bacteroidales bacterium]|nr:ribonuclease HII [Bacteroidales bacterium]